MFSFCRHISSFRQLHSSYFLYHIHPFFPWSSSSPPSISVCQHHSFFQSSDRITCPKNTSSFLLSAVCCGVSSSSIPISMRTLSLVFFSVHDILCIFLHIHISHALIFFPFSLHFTRVAMVNSLTSPQHNW